MSALQVRFVTCEDPVSRAIRGALHGFPFSHVELIWPESQEVIGAFIELGIAFRPFDYGKDEWTKTLVVTVPCLPEEAQKALAFAKSQVGTPYDVAALLSMVQGALVAHLPGWDKSESYICSAFVTTVLLHAGVFKSFPIDPREATPRDVLVGLAALVGLAGGVNAE